MAKRQISVTVDQRLICAPIFELDHMQWLENRLGCPYCGVFLPIKPMIDVIQFGLTEGDNMHTIVQCDNCSKFFALHYINTKEIEE